MLSQVKAHPGISVTPIPAEVHLQKGLFIVLLYAAFEFSVNRLITDLSLFVSSESIPCNHIDRAALGLVLDPQFKSIATPGGKNKKWERRASLIERQASADPATVHDEALTSELGNIWPNALVQIFSAFGLTHSPFYSKTVSQYIHEVVDKRNAVAHGRESPITVGQSYTIQMLENLLEEIEKQKDYLFGEFDSYLTTKSYIHPAHRAAY